MRKGIVIGTLYIGAVLCLATMFDPTYGTFDGEGKTVACVLTAIFLSAVTIISVVDFTPAELPSKRKVKR